MDLFSAILIIIGLVLFEVVSSIDNAIINADVLATMGDRARKFFVTWGIFFAVFVVRGFLPWIIVWAAVPSLGFLGSFTATFSNDPAVHDAIARSAPILLMGGGIFLLFLFLHWLLLEEKQYGFHFEKTVDRHGVWFYAVASVTLSLVVWHAMRVSPMIAFGAVVGSTAFFIVHGFRLQAEKAEEELKRSSMSDWSKVFFLEVIDLSFSIDGVLGAFAFTLSVPLILIGNGIGAVIVRQLTLAHVDRVKKYAYLKNGAMYSIGVLGIVMIAHGFLIHIPSFFSPLATIVIIGYFFRRSLRAEGV
jgi:hypothetical protein